MKTKMWETGIEAAIGVTWEADGKSVKAQLKETDDLMYIDKRSYHGRDNVTDDKETPIEP